MINTQKDNLNRGILTISLDFELYWGMRDEMSIEEYRDHLAGVYQAVPEILNLFQQYQIHATWATVGFLHFTNFEELKNNLPKQLPSYKDPNLSPYQYIDRLTTEDNVNLHFCRLRSLPFDISYEVKNLSE